MPYARGGRPQIATAAILKYAALMETCCKRLGRYECGVEMKDRVTKARSPNAVCKERRVSVILMSHVAATLLDRALSAMACIHFRKAGAMKRKGRL